MVETKSVKVDNWGVFFLQKLQNFFNKTDYCDLTLQFNDNSQLKVHRLVLSACTDYFNVLEQHCDMADDTLIMPGDLQADVVVPIVNFMYTGTLEFEVNMYGRLLKTAKDMNMTVLLKLLEAHKRTVDIQPIKQLPILLNKAAGQRMNTYSRVNVPPTTRTYTPRKAPIITKIKTEKPEFKVAVRPQQPISYIRKNIPEPVQLVAKYANTTATAAQKGPSRFDYSDEIVTGDQFESSFDDISYESRPLITASQIKEERDLDEQGPSTSSGSFEQLRKSYTGANKRPASSLSFGSSPPEKKPNIQDVKEYTEAHRMRKEIVAEEFEDESEEYVDEPFLGDDDPHRTHKESLTIKNEPGNVNHAKIISEVLKKYPHLVKNNKNIKLKIMQKGNTSQTITAPLPPPPPPPTKTSPLAKYKPQSSAPVASATAPKKIDSKTMHALIAKGAENMTGPWLCLKCGVNGRPISIPSYKGFRRHLVNVHKEKIDAKLCEHCGWKSTKKVELHHHILLTHNIKPPSEMRFPKCPECNYIAPDNQSLKKHREEAHYKRTKLNTHHCIYCNKTFSDEISVYDHMRSNHKERACEDGVMDFDEDEEDSDKYIPNNELAGVGDNKIKIISNITLPTKGIPYVLDPNSHTISSIGGNAQHGNINLEPSSEAEGLSNVASGIATSLGVLDSNVSDDFHGEGHGNNDSHLLPNNYIEEAMANVHGEFSKKSDIDHGVSQDDDDDEQEVTQFVTEEGSTLQLTESQKADLLQQLQDQRGVVMILNDDGFDHSQEIINNPDQQGIVVVYSQASDLDKPKLVTTTADISTDMVEHNESESMEWHEEIHAEHSADNDDESKLKESDKNKSNIDEEMREYEAPSITTTKSDDSNTKCTKSESSLTAKKIIEGDWSDDDELDENDECPVDPPAEDIKILKQDKEEATSASNKRSYKGKDTKTKENKEEEKVKAESANLDVKDTSTVDSEDKQDSSSRQTKTAVNQENEKKLENKEVKADIQKISKEKEKTPPNEIKTLIKDWDDDEDDDDNTEHDATDQ